ncbi:alpha-ketoglutarate-dependent dioxygenase AlkB family protein [Salinibius halmophilus]|uniref:alpha-ketoglutarate-dependent dioxygenase AlkB family protein n=1 Tax=Salinibius halmophilus TaxID=1853216 RepID=UPI000E67552C|nr:alpha-ketoglutarate-dependent dioxygenase AlkB [Salinibius halmophilus]
MQPVQTVSHMLYYPNWLENSETSDLISQLAGLPWRQDYLILYGKKHAIPRQHLWLAASQQSYRYSGISMQSAGWPHWLAALTERLNQQFDTRFNSALANHYRGGQDKMGWHSDDEPELGQNPVIAIVSLGVARYLGVRRKGETKMLEKVCLDHGSLLLMPSGFQSHWQHALLAQSPQLVTQSRYSLTFRHTGDQHDARRLL